LAVRAAPYTTANFVRRPGFGQAGMKTRVFANHYAISFRQGGATTYHYDVLSKYIKFPIVIDIVTNF
jgi:hypothetical protein